MEMSNQWCWHMLWKPGWTDPTRDMAVILEVLSTQCVRFVFRPGIFACTWWIYLLMGYQTLHRNRVVIKVAFRFVLKHDARRGQSKEGSFPSLHREISLGPSSDRIQKCMTMLQIVNLIRDSESHDRKIISWGKGKGMYTTLWWFVRCDLYARLGVGMSCYRPLPTIVRVEVLVSCLFACEPISHTLKRSEA
jgi:hypothetical protein